MICMNLSQLYAISLKLTASLSKSLKVKELRGEDCTNRDDQTCHSQHMTNSLLPADAEQRGNQKRPNKPPIACDQVSMAQHNQSNRIGRNMSKRSLENQPEKNCNTIHKWDVSAHVLNSLLDRSAYCSIFTHLANRYEFKVHHDHHHRHPRHNRPFLHSDHCRRSSVLRGSCSRARQTFPSHLP